MGDINTGYIFSNGETNVNHTKLNAAVNDATIKNAAVTTAKIADNAITTDKLAAEAVTPEKLTATIALLPIGVPLPYFGASLPSGRWLWCNGQTIGNAASGATARANGDTQTLYELLWNSVANAELPIQDSAGTATTRGASASADFNANKRLPLPDCRGRVLVGRDDMGTAGAASRVTNSGTGNPGIAGATLGASGGVDRHTLTTAQMPSHTHSIGFNSVGSGSTPTAASQGGGGPINTSSSGSGQAHPNCQPSLISNAIIAY